MMLKAIFAGLSPPGPTSRLSVLIFHRVLSEHDPLFPLEPDIQRFDQILSWLARWMNVIPLSEAMRRLGDGTLPPAAASITFDDGYFDNLTNALPVLQKHGMPATFFVASSFLNGGNMWNDILIHAVRTAVEGSFDLSDIGLKVLSLPAMTAGRREFLEVLLRQVKYLPQEQRDGAVETVRRRLQAPLPEPMMMNSDQVRRLRACGMDIGAHTRSHPILARVGDEVARDEIVRGKHDLESLLDEEVSLFAYPNGKPLVDYEPKHVEMVRSARFRGAVSTSPGCATMGMDRFQIPRFSPWDRNRLKYAVRMLSNLRTTPSLA